MLSSLQPKEKPLRTKRGHRKPAFLTDLDSNRATSTFVQNNQAVTLSPSNSDAFSHTQTAAPRPAITATNGTKPSATSETPKKPRTPFELFANENRSVLLGAHTQLSSEGNYDVDKELATKWQEMGNEGRSQYHHRFESGDYGVQASEPRSVSKSRDRRDEDVDMGEEGEDEEEG